MNNILLIINNHILIKNYHLLFLNVLVLANSKVFILSILRVFNQLFGGCKMDAMCHDGMCAKCWGGKFLVSGVVVLLTAIYWPGYIWHVLGILLILKGIMKFSMPACSHCQPMAMKKSK